MAESLRRRARGRARTSSARGHRRRRRLERRHAARSCAPCGRVRRGRAAPRPPIRWRFRATTQNRGKGAAVRTALAAATCDITVIHDADLEYHPRDLLRIVAVFVEEEADAVLWLAVRRRRTAARPALPARARQPVAHVPVEPRHQPEPDRHGDVLQGGPHRPAEVDPARARTTSASSRSSRSSSRSGRRASSRCRSATRAAPTRKARRSTGSDGFRALARDRQVLRFRTPSTRRDAVRQPHRWRVWRARRTSTAGWPTRSGRYCGNRVLEIGSGIGNLTQRLVPRHATWPATSIPLYLAALADARDRSAVPADELLRRDRPRVLSARSRAATTPSSA